MTMVSNFSVLFILFGCAQNLTPKNEPSELTFQNQNSESNHVDDEGYNPKKSLHHPKKQDANATFILISTQKPDAVKVQDCKKKLTQSVPKALSLKELQSASENVLIDVQFNLKNYHWCFYQMMVDVDLDLAQSKKSFEELGDIFILAMQKMYIIAHALNKVLGVNTYTDYLKVRYMQISQQKFGRVLSGDSHQIFQK